MWRDSARVCLALGVAACTPPTDGLGDDGASISGAETTTTAGATTSDPSGTGGESSGAESSETGEVIYDVGAGGETGHGQMGCSKIDFLFVIDNSGSMGDEQDNLIGSFPGFIAAIEQASMTDDFHVMVVDSDAYLYGGLEIGCQNDPPCCDTYCGIFPGSTCNDTPCPDADFSCDGTLGAGVDQDVVGQDCGILGGTRYMTKDQPDLAGTFACAAEVGVAGADWERPIGAMLEAISPTLNQAGGCNEGFVRDDAILVVTIITDEEDDEMKSDGDPAQWKQLLVDAKGGDETAVVVLGLFNDGDVPEPVCGVQPSPRLHEFVDSFTETGVWGPVCAPDYAPFFADAVGLIDSVCEEFEPPG